MSSNATGVGPLRSARERLGRHRVHLYFYHTAGAPAPLEKGTERGGDEPGQLGGALDHEAPARGRRGSGSAQRRERVDGEAGDGGGGRRGLLEERARRRGRLATRGDVTQALVWRVAELGAEAQLLAIEGFALAVPGRGERIVIGVKRLGDHAAGAAHRLRRRPEKLEDTLARAKVRDAQEAIQPDESHRAPSAGAAPAQQGRRPDHDLGARIGAGDGEAWEAPAHRGLDALGIPAERGEPPAPARRTPIRERLLTARSSTRVQLSTDGAPERRMRRLPSRAARRMRMLRE